MPSTALLARCCPQTAKGQRVQSDESVPLSETHVAEHRPERALDTGGGVRGVCVQTDTGNTLPHPKPLGSRMIRMVQSPMLHTQDAPTCPSLQEG